MKENGVGIGIAVLRLARTPVNSPAIQRAAAYPSSSVSTAARIPQHIRKHLRRRLPRYGRNCSAARQCAPFRSKTCQWSRSRRPAVSVRPSRSSTPAARPFCIRSAATSPCLMNKFGSCSRTSFIRIRYSFLSHWARGDQTAGPRLVFNKPKLDAGRVRNFAHHPAQGVDLAHQMTLGNPANRRIAGHLGNQIRVHGDHGGLQAQPRSTPAPPRNRHGRRQPLRRRIYNACCLYCSFDLLALT